MTMALQVKIYTAHSTWELERALNADLDNVCEAEIIDIKYTIKSSYKCDPKEYSAMVIFK